MQVPHTRPPLATHVVDCIVPAPAVPLAAQGSLNEYSTPAAALTFSTSTSSSVPAQADFEEWSSQQLSIVREPVAERMGLRQQAQEAAAERTAAELLREEEVGGRAEIQEKGKREWFGLCTRWQPQAGSCTKMLGTWSSPTRSSCLPC